MILKEKKKAICKLLKWKVMSHINEVMIFFLKFESTRIQISPLVIVYINWSTRIPPPQFNSSLSLQFSPVHSSPMKIEMCEWNIAWIKDKI